MIKTALFALTVMGCDCDQRLCEFVSETPPQWTTVAECEAAISLRIAQSRNLNYPLVTGLCRPALEAAPVETVSTPANAAAEIPAAGAAGPIEADARLSLYEDVLRGSQVAFRRTADGYVMVKSGVGGFASRAVDLVKTSAAYLSPGRLIGD